MDIKAVEIRDRATMIAALAFRRGAGYEPADQFLAAAGYGPIAPAVILVTLDNPVAQNDPYAWRGGRTLHEAHKYIEAHWAELGAHAVVDVEFILGETKAPKAGDIRVRAT